MSTTTTTTCTESCKTLLPASVVNQVEEALNILLINNTRSFAAQAPIKTVLSLGALAVGVALAHVAIWKRQCRVTTEEDKTTFVFALVFLWIGFESTIANARVILNRYDLTLGTWVLETVADPLIGMLVLFVVYRQIVHSLPTCSNPALERLDSIIFQTLLAVPPVLQFLRVVVEACESSAATGMIMFSSMGFIILLFFCHERIVRATPSPAARTRVLGVLFGIYVVLQRFLTFQERFVKHVQTLRAQKIAYEAAVQKFQLNALVRDNAGLTGKDQALLRQQYEKLWNVFDNRSERGSKIVSYLQPAANVSDVMVLSAEGVNWLNNLGQRNETISQWWHAILPDPKEGSTFTYNANASHLVLLATIMVREQNAVNSVLFWKLFLDWLESQNRNKNQPFVLETFRSPEKKEQRNEWCKSHRLSTRFEPDERQQRQFRRFLVNHVICKSSGATNANPVLTDYLEKDVSVPGLAQLIIITATPQLSGVPTSRRASPEPQKILNKVVKSMETDDSDASCANLLWLWYLLICFIVLFPLSALLLVLWKRITIIQDSPTVLYGTVGWAILTNILMRMTTRQVMEEQHVGVMEEQHIGVQEAE